MDSEFINQQRARISALCREINDIEKHFCYILGEVQLFEAYFPNGDLKSALIKKIVSDALQQFNAVDKYKVDGKYSTEMKMNGVMSRLDDLGYFRNVPEFYVVWAEYWAEQKNRQRVDELISKCLERCKCENSVELFRPIIEMHFENISEISALVKLIPKTKPQEKLKRSMSGVCVMEVLEEKSSVGSGNTTAGNDNPTMAVQNQASNAESAAGLQPSKGAAEEEVKLSQTPKTGIHSFTTNMYKNAYDVFAQTLPFYDNGCIQSPPTKPTESAQSTSDVAAKAKPSGALLLKEGFAVYCDETTRYNTANNQPSKKIDENIARRDTSLVQEKGDQLASDQLGGISNIKKTLKPTQIPSPLMNEKISPCAKRMRRVELSFNENSLLGESVDSPMSSKLDKNLKKNTPEFPCGDDDVTVAGAHGKLASMGATSTPRLAVVRGATSAATQSAYNFNFHASVDNESIFGSPLVPPSVRASLPMALNSDNNAKKSLNIGAPILLNVEEKASKEYNENILKPKQCKTMNLEDALPRLSIKPSLEKESPMSRTRASNEDKENIAFKEIAGVGELLKQQRHQRVVPLDENVVQEKCTSPNICTNPWDEKERSEILKLTSIMSLSKCHDFTNQESQKIEVGRRLELGGELFSITKMLGEGGFAKVYRGVNDENKSYAIKWERPACPWEVYICDALLRRLPPKCLNFVMEVHDAFIFSDSSIIVYEYYPCGTLLDLNNHYKKDGMEFGGLMVTYLGIQLARILDQVHEAKIIHADVKPDNIVIAASIPIENCSIKSLLDAPTIKLIDWGRSIEMYYNPERQFIGRAGTKCFDCIEMVSNRPWNYQTDFFGYVATVHVLMFGEYLVTIKEHNKIRPVKQIKRRFTLRSMWLNIFEKFLNIPNCKSLPSWKVVNAQMEVEFTKEVGEQPLEWRKAVERFNNSFNSMAV